MSRTALIDRLQTRIGLDPESLGANTLDHAIDEACAALGCQDALALLVEIDRSPENWQRFVDCMVVPETWFFRVPEQFEDLRRFAQTRRPMRVLSLPCATGEEAYSIAIVLLEAGLTAGSIDVLGIDVGAAQVAHARRGRYRAYSFRGSQPAPAWFDREGDEFVVTPALRRLVRFRTGNVLDPGLFAGERFDAIFFRNLLIYLDVPSRRYAVQQLLSVLDNGLIFAGQAEVLSSVDPRLQPAPNFGALTFAPTALTPEPAPMRTPAPARKPMPAKPAPKKAPPAPVPPPDVAERLADARRYADAGRLDAARDACKAALSQRPESAEAWFLLGMIEIAAGALDRADEALQRVSYLDRGHLDALAHRAALAERMGRRDEAQQLRARVKRMEPRP